MTFPPQPRQEPYSQNPYGPRHNQRPQNPHGQAGRPYPGSPGYVHNRGYPAGPGYGYPPAPAGYGTQPVKPKTGLVVAVIIVLMLGLGVGGFVGIKVLTGRPSPTDSDRQVGVEQNGITYSVTVPDGLMQLEPTPDTSVPSELKLEFRLADKPFEGGEIQIGAVAEGLAHRTVEDIAAEAEQSHSHYRNNPEGRVSRAAATVAGRPATAIEVSYQWEGGRYSRQYFIDARPGTPALYLSCDWNDVATVAIDAMCAQMVRSMTIGR